MLCDFKCVEVGFIWAFYGVYGLNANLDGWLMWWGLWDVLWCIGGDFNVVRFPNEILGSGRLTLAMWDFSYFIMKQGLVYIHLKEKCSLGNRQESPTMSRIDSFLAFTAWEEHFNDASQKITLTVLLDHSYIDAGEFKPNGKKTPLFPICWPIYHKSGLLFL